MGNTLFKIRLFRKPNFRIEEPFHKSLIIDILHCMWIIEGVSG